MEGVEFLRAARVGGPRGGRDAGVKVRQARQQASLASTPSVWRRHRWWLATACSALLAVPLAMQFNHSTQPPAAPLIASQNADAGDDNLLFDESPELYLWLGSDNLAME